MKRNRYTRLHQSKKDKFEEHSKSGFLTYGLPIIISLLIGLLIVATSEANGQNPNTYIPPRAFEHRDDLYDAIKRNITELPDYNYVGALIEHESCISLTHSRCWSSTSELSNSREYSVGFFQIAKAYNSNGTIRMDTLTSMKNKYKTRLREANWNNLKHRPDLQMDVGTLLIGENYRRYYMAYNDFERMAFQDAAYNGGAGWVDKERRACGLKEGCDSTRWFGHVETTCLRSKNPIKAYGNRSICTISRQHVTDVLKTRLPKYQEQYFNKEYLDKKK